MSGSRTKQSPQNAKNIVTSTSSSRAELARIRAARAFIREKFSPLIKEVTQKGQFKDAKSILQEKLQAKTKQAPEYEIEKEEGPDHDKHFTVGVYSLKKLLAKGEGKSKQAAQEAAAQKALGKIK